MVEIKAQLIGGSVVVAGDTILVRVSVTAPPLDPATSVQSSELNESVGWGSAQVHCICTVNEKIVSLPPERKTSDVDSVVNSSTSFAPWRGEKGNVVLATKPKILFCDLQMMPGQTRSFLYRESIPSDAPPSFRGKMVKYTYKVTVGTQKMGSEIKLLRIPFRLIVLQGVAPLSCNSETEDLAPSNPFLRTPLRENPNQMAMQFAQSLWPRRAVSQYRIGHGAFGHVASLTVYKSSFRLGEDIVATLDFTKADIACVQFSATLQSEEEVCSAFRVQPSSASCVVSCHAKTHDVCLSLSHSHFTITTPTQLTPTFSTDIVSVRWLLHFEFVLNTGGEAKVLPGFGDKDSTENGEGGWSQADDKGATWSAPAVIGIETLVWDLPVSLRPASPKQLAHADTADTTMFTTTL